MAISLENSGTDAEIEQLHGLLTAHFINLRATRPDAPLYLLEHEVEGDDLAQLIAMVRASLARHRIESGWWSSQPLTLLVAATEIGYVYRGTGTDFWPIFAEQLGDASVGDRVALSTLFRRSSAKLGLAQPPNLSYSRGRDFGLF